MRFTLYRIRFEIFEKGDDSCIIKATIEYDVKEKANISAIQGDGGVETISS